MRTFAAGLSLALAVLAVVSGCRPRGAAPPPAAAPSAAVPLPAGDWPLFRGDPAFTGVLPGPGPQRLRRVWSTPLGAPSKGSPVVAGGRIFVGTDAGTLLAVGTDGTVLWRYAAGAALEAPPLALAAWVFVGAEDGTLHAVDAVRGERAWSFRAEDKIVGSANALPATPERPALVLFGSYDTHVYALDAPTGERRWQYATRNYVNGAPAVTAAGEIVFGGCDGQVHVLGADGSAVAAIDAGSYVAAAPGVADGVAYVGTYGNEFLAVDLRAGRVAWRFAPAADAQPFFASPALAADRVVTGARDGFVYCLRRSDGTLLWHHRTGGEVDAAPVIVGDTVLAGSADGRLYLLALADGRLLAQYELGGAIQGSPAVAAGLVLVVTTDGVLHALEAAP